MKRDIRVRFAPSPTGYLHIGNARTALFNWLFARHNEGTFIVRIEDTDTDRHVAEAEGLILHDLKWLGLDWEEGPDKGGAYGPYRQSDRLGIYHDYAQKLLKEDNAYYCYCTPEELETSRKHMLSQGEMMPRYDGRCAHLTDEERLCFKREGRKPSIRFRVPGTSVVVNDLIRGEVSFDEKTLGDFIIVRSDGRPAYNFAVVIDDILMEISHVLRGEDHLSNTPRQILIYQALGCVPPQFGHMSMILGPDRTRLSKRHGATSVVSYREEGYLPEALCNYLALLGWSPPDEKEIFSLEKLVQQFSIERISKSAAIFDTVKLNWINAFYIREAELNRLTLLCLPYFERHGYIKAVVPETDLSNFEQMVASVRHNVSYLAQIPDLISIYIEDKISIDSEGLAWLEKEESILVIKRLQEVLVSSSDEVVADSPGLIKAVQKKSGQKGKSLYMPIRVALTGKTGGPELTAVFTILGRQRCLQRIEQVLSGKSHE